MSKLPEKNCEQVTPRPAGLREAAAELAQATSGTKNGLLHGMADALVQRSAKVIEANEQDSRPVEEQACRTASSTAWP